MKVIVAGGRDFRGTHVHEKWLKEQLEQLRATHIISGMARGADMFGFYVGKDLGLKTLSFPADWDKHGKSAGYKRNIEMADNANALIVFPGGKGTEHMKNIAINKGLEVIEYKED